MVGSADARFRIRSVYFGDTLGLHEALIAPICRLFIFLVFLLFNYLLFCLYIFLFELHHGSIVIVTLSPTTYVAGGVGLSGSRRLPLSVHVAGI